MNFRMLTAKRVGAFGLAVALASSVAPVTAATKTTKKAAKAATTKTTVAPAAEAPTTAAPAAPAKPKSLDVTMLSTQFTPLVEAENMRKEVLKGYGGKVEFVPADAAAFAARIQAEGKSGSGKVDVVAGLIGDLSAQTKYLKDLSGMKAEFASLNIPQSMWDLGKLGTDKQLCIPWIQATLIMVVNKKALPYLPSGVDVNALTHDQFITWLNNIYSKTGGQRKLGFSAGSGGLVHRYLQGYLVPSYTKGVNTTFASADSVTAWNKFKNIWEYVNPQSTTYNFQQDPLQSEEVWIGIDHVARIKDAVVNRPNDFVAVPVPSGPKGRSYMAILGCVGVMSSSSNVDAAQELIRFLDKPETSATTLKLNGFYPVGSQELPSDLSPGLKIISKAVERQGKAKDSFGTLIPAGLGSKGGDYNKVWLDTFRAIVLQDADVASTLATQRVALQKVLDDAQAPCWFPDASSGESPCRAG